MTSIATKAETAALRDRCMTPAEWADANPERAEQLAREVLRAGEAALVPYMLRSLAEADGFPAPHSTVVLELRAAIVERMKHEAEHPVPVSSPEGTCRLVVLRGFVGKLWRVIACDAAGREVEVYQHTDGDEAVRFAEAYAARLAAPGRRAPAVEISAEPAAPGPVRDAGGYVVGLLLMLAGWAAFAACLRLAAGS